MALTGWLGSSPRDSARPAAAFPHLVVITQEVDAGADTLGFVHSWLKRLSERVAWLDVLALRVGAQELPPHVRVHAVGGGAGRGGRLGRAFRFWRCLREALGGGERSLVFCHMCPQYVVAAYPLARLRGVPVAYWQTHKQVGWAQRLAHRLADRVLTASPESFRIRSRRVLVLGHGVDTDWFRAPDGPRALPRVPPRWSIVGVGRISPIKGWETLIEAAGLLVHRHGRRDLVFRIVGGDAFEDPAYGRRLRARVEELGLGGWVRFEGPVPHGRIRDHYWAGDIFVSTSLTGSLDKAVLEAMACGLPPVVCIEAFRGLLGPYGERLMYPEGDAGALASRILGLLGRVPREWDEMASWLRRAVEREHRLEDFMDRLVRLFWELSGAPRGRGWAGAPPGPGR